MLEKKLELDTITILLGGTPVIEVRRIEQIYEDGQPYGVALQRPPTRYTPGSLSEEEQTELDAMLGEVVLAQQEALQRALAAAQPAVADAPPLPDAERHAFEVQIAHLESELRHRDAALALAEQELQEAQAAVPSDARPPMNITPS